MKRNVCYISTNEPYSSSSHFQTEELCKEQKEIEKKIQFFNCKMECNLMDRIFVSDSNGKLLAEKKTAISLSGNSMNPKNYTDWTIFSSMLYFF